MMMRGIARWGNSWFLVDAESGALMYWAIDAPGQQVWERVPA